MSDTLTLLVDNFEIYSERRDINPTVFGGYCEADKRVTPIIQNAEECTVLSDDNGFEQEGPTHRVEYVVTAQVALDRLELTGFSLAEVRQYFEVGIAELIKDFHTWNEAKEASDDRFKNMVEARESIIRSLTLDKWLDGLKLIVDEGYEWDCRIDWWTKEYSKIPLHVRYMLSCGSKDLYGFPGFDCRPYLRAVIEVIGDRNSLILLDLTDMVYGESIGLNEEMCSWSRRQLAEDSVVNHKIVVLCEGKTDKAVLEGSLQLLYPHLVEFYSFIDFDGARVRGGAGAQVNTLKAFIGAGIVNRIIAIFDNDTAAKVATRSLSEIRLPENVRVLFYPDLALARDYPTLGPQGIFSMDVNGLAAGIELYLGTDVLCQSDGSLTPVQWRGYDQSIQQYQGEVINKDALHQKFAEKLKTCKADQVKIGNYDWSEVALILTAIRMAFVSN